MAREGLVHHGLNLQFGGHRHRIALSELLTGGRSITVYGQQEVVKDLIVARLAAGGQVRFDVGGRGGRRDRTTRPAGDPVPAGRVPARGAALRFRGRLRRLPRCVPGRHRAGCAADLPAGAPLRLVGHPRPGGAVDRRADLRFYHERGFALPSLRSAPEITRLYLQVDPTAEPLAEWPDERIWAELHVRLESAPGGRSPPRGRSSSAGSPPCAASWSSPCSTAASIWPVTPPTSCPPTGAKGMNLAIADVKVLADALARLVPVGGDDSRIDPLLGDVPATGVAGGGLLRPKP